MARLGNALRGEAGKPLAADQRQFYRDVAERGGRYAPAVVLKMLDKDMELLEGMRKGAAWYFDARQEKQEVAQGVLVSKRVPVVPAGAAGLYSAKEAQQFGLCQLIKESRQDVAEAYQLPASSLREDPLLKRCGVNFSQATLQEREQVTQQLDRLARTRYWNEIRSVIGSLYQRAFGV